MCVCSKDGALFTYVIIQLLFLAFIIVITKLNIIVVTLPLLFTHTECAYIRIFS